MSGTQGAGLSHQDDGDEGAMGVLEDEREAAASVLTGLSQS